MTTQQIKERAAFLKAEKAAHDADYARRIAIGAAKAKAKIESLKNAN
jgi:hypothetical protein